ncbi:MAG TPA: hypothetical protein PLO47_01200 [Bacillota bacterium]|nr:hypothetical protein [Bacillota bacterium]
MKIKTILGIALIILSVAAMFFWESHGRDRFTTRVVLVCAEDIGRGSRVGPESFSSMRVREENVLQGALDPALAAELYGMTAREDMVAKQQVRAECFFDEKSALSNGESLFVIPSEWIMSRSSALRGGDIISIYVMPGMKKLGKYTVAFVKDDMEQEVRDLLGATDRVLERTDSGRVIAGIEIICGLSDYEKIYNEVMSVRYPPAQQGEEGADSQPEAQAEAQADPDADIARLLIVIEDAI